MQQQPPAMQNPTQTNHSSNPSVTDMRRAFDAFGIQQPTTNSGQRIVEFIQSSGAPRDGVRLSLDSNPDIPKLGGTDLQGGSNTPNVSLPLASNSRSNTSQTQGVQQAASSLQHSVINDMFCLERGTEAAVNKGMDSHLPGYLQPDEKTVSEVSGGKEWHQSVTPDLRNHLIHKLVRAIFPSSDPQALRDKRIHNLVAFAQRVENDMYDMANSRSEYYHLLAAEIYKIQKELEEKRQKRKEQQMQQQHQPQVQPDSRSNSLSLGSAKGCSELAE